MIQAIKKWLADGAERKKQRRIQDGFGWAMSAFFIENLPMCHIESIHECNIQMSINGFDDFDYGVTLALAELDQLIIESPRVAKLNQENGQ